MSKYLTRPFFLHSVNLLPQQLCPLGIGFHIAAFGLLSHELHLKLGLDDQVHNLVFSNMNFAKPGLETLMHFFPTNSIARWFTGKRQYRTNRHLAVFFFQINI